MKAFTIDAENNIAVHASAKAAPKTEGTEVFTSEGALAELAATWPASRLVEIFNSLTGVTPVKKFTSRGIAVARIWKAIQTLGEAEVPQSADAAPEQAPAKTKASRVKKAPKPPQEAEADVLGTVAPNAPDAAPEEATAKNDATAPTDAPAAAGDEELLRSLSRLRRVDARAAGREVGRSEERARHDEADGSPPGRAERSATRGQQDQPGDSAAEARGWRDP
jgi:hypothetical protein